MKRIGFILSVLIVLGLAVTAVSARDAAKTKSGEELFKTNCVCHPDGGNIVNPSKTLHKKDREANGVKKVADVIARMRNPGPGMTRFDQSTIPDRDARKIADYIFKTFK